MIPAQAQRQYWCLHCGNSAIYLAESMDPKRPLGLCQDIVHPCGRILVSSDRIEVARMIEAVKEQHRIILEERRRVGGKQSNAVR